MLTTIEWSPLLMTSDNGKYKVKYNGLYLVYINVSMYVLEYLNYAKLFTNFLIFHFFESNLQFE